jgi:PhnB protein
MQFGFDAKKTERYSMPDGSIGHAEVRIGNSVFMVSDAQGKWIEQFGYVSNWPD